jgi:hypothetical protein
MQRIASGASLCAGKGEDATALRRPRDIEAELKALQDRARQLKSKQKAQLGELLMATGAAEALDPDALAGLLPHGIEQAKREPKAVEGWRRRGEAFFSPRAGRGRCGRISRCCEQR